MAVATPIYQCSILDAGHDSKISFLKDGHCYNINGQIADYSVTSFVATLYNKFPRHLFSSLDLSKFNYKALIGTITHALIQHDLEGTLIPEKYLNNEKMQMDFQKYHTYHEKSLIGHKRQQFYEAFSYISALNSAISLFEVYKSYKKTYLEQNKTLSFCTAEYMIWMSTDHKLIAGCIDAIFWYGNPEDRKVVVVDWKTNKSIYDNKSKIKSTDSPFHGQYKITQDKLMCQLHIYKYILEKKYNVTVVQYALVHIQEKQFSIITSLDDGTCDCIVALEACGK